jgi:uncharacterized protein YdcH (DUF465 family)
MERLLQIEREKNLNLSNEVIKYSTMVEEKNELIKNLRHESSKYKEDFEKLNNIILSKLTALLNKPGAQPQNLKEIQRLLSSVNKLDHDISRLQQNNKEIISKHENNFYILKDQLNKATDEMRNSRKVETITKTIIKAPPLPPVVKRYVSKQPITKKVIKASRSPSKVYREIPVRSGITYEKKCHCNCNQITTNTNCYTIEKCPICNVGMVNAINKRNYIASEFQNKTKGFIVDKSENQSNLYSDALTEKVYQRRSSTEPMKYSGIQNHYLKTSNVQRGNSVSSRYSERYSADPLGGEIRSRLRKSNAIAKESDPYGMSNAFDNIEKKASVIRR